MKKLLFLSVAIALVSCGGETKVEKAKSSNLVTITGKITNPVSKNVYVELDNLLDSAIVNEKGMFSMDFELSNPSQGAFHHGHEMAFLMVSPGDSFNITLDPEMFDETIKFSGKGADANNFFAQSLLKDEENYNNHDALFSMETSGFLAKIDKEKADRLAQLEKSLAGLKGFETLYEEQKKEIEYNWAHQKMTYPNQFYYLKDQEAELDSSYYNFLEDINFNDVSALSVGKYKLFLLAAANYKASSYTVQDEKLKMAKLYGYVKENHTGQVRDELLLNVVKGAVRNMPFEASTPIVLEDFATVNPEKHATLKAMFDEYQKLKPGSDAPDFAFPNENGDTVKLSDLRGKFVYIDVWATWCAPCREEIPFLKTLVESFEGNENITFLQISVDKAEDKDKWLEMIKEENIDAIQLFADNWDDAICKAYSIDGIPRFMLIGPDGKIIDAFASRPSGNAKALIEVKMKSAI